MYSKYIHWQHTLAKNNQINARNVFAFGRGANSVLHLKIYGITEMKEINLPKIAKT